MKHHRSRVDRNRRPAQLHEIIPGERRLQRRQVRGEEPPEFVVGNVAVETRSSLEGERRSQNEATKSASFVTTTRASWIASAVMASSGVRLLRGKAKTCIASWPAALS